MMNSLVKLIITTVFSMVLTMVSAFLLAHLLSVEDRGIFQLIVTSSTYLATFAVGGVGFALALSMRHHQYKKWRGYFAAFLSYALLVGSIALFFLPFKDIKFLFVFNVLLLAILTITLEKSKIDENLHIYRLLIIQQPILAVTIYGICYLVLGEQSIHVVVYLLTLLSAIQGVLCLLYLKRIENEYKHKKNIENIDRTFFFKTWLKQNLLQIFGATTTNIDKFLIVALLGNYTLGLYTVCMAFDALLTRFINILADYYYSGLLNHLDRIKIILLIMLIMGIAGIMITPLLAEQVISLFFSDKYIEVASILIWFILNSIIAGLSWVLSQNMLILGKQLLLFTRQIISIFVFVGLFYLFRDLELLGVAYALIGASLTRLIIAIIYFYQYPISLTEKSAV